MKRITPLLLIILFMNLGHLKSQNSDEQWDVYLASYEDEKPGSTTIRLDLLNSAPINQYNYVLVTGITYKTKREDGFPEDKTFSLLHQIGDELIAILTKESSFLSVGSFTYNNERLEYFYLSDSTGIRSILKKYYQRKLF